MASSFASTCPESPISCSLHTRATHRRPGYLPTLTLTLSPALTLTPSPALAPTLSPSPPLFLAQGISSAADRLHRPTVAWDAAIAAADPLQGDGDHTPRRDAPPLAGSGRPQKQSCMQGFKKQGPSVGPWAASLRSGGSVGAGGGGAGPRSLADEETFARKNAIWDLMREQVRYIRYISLHVVTYVTYHCIRYTSRLHT